MAGGIAWAVVAASAPAFASDDEPRLTITVPSEVQYNNTYRSQNQGAELGDAFAKIEPELILRLRKALSMETQVTYEPANATPARDRFFDNQALYLKSLYLKYDQGGVSALAGKFAPGFGLAWDAAPGVFGRDFARDYELTEQVGVSGALTLPGPLDTEHTLALAVFHRDNSEATRSLFNKRPRVRERDGGAANTDGFESYSATLAGTLPGILSGYSYQLSYDHLAAGRGNPTDEDGYAVALFGETALTDAWKLVPFAELAYFSGAKAAAEDRTYGTLGLSITDDVWEANVSATFRTIDPDAAGTATTRDKLFQGGVSRALPHNFNLGLGYRYAEEAQVESHTVGMLLKHEFSFSPF